MKNKTPVMGQRIQTQIPDWLCKETQEDDFLMGKTPKDLPDFWDDEE